MISSDSSNTNPWMISTLLLAGLIAGFGIAQIPGLDGNGQQAVAVQEDKDAGADAVVQEPTEAETQVLTAEQIAALPDDDTVIGDAKAPITLVEFSDFQCPYCSRFATASFPQIEENYIKTGKVKFIYRDFPLDGHPQAQLAAEVSECADEQGKFKQMHDQLFAEQVAWSGNPEAQKIMHGYAKKMGLDTKKFNECVTSKKYSAEVRKDLIDGAAVGVNGTPGFFVNGKSISGAMPYDLVFKPLLDAELEGKKWTIQYDATGKPSVKVE